MIKKIILKNKIKIKTKRNILKEILIRYTKHKIWVKVLLYFKKIFINIIKTLFFFFGINC